MTRSAFVILATLCLAAPAFAQTPAPASSTTAVSPSTPSDVLKDGKRSAKSVRKECRASTKAQGLKGDERRKAEMACVVKARPDLAAKEQCRMDARTQKIAKDARKAFVRDCVNKG